LFCVNFYFLSNKNTSKIIETDLLRKQNEKLIFSIPHAILHRKKGKDFLLTQNNL